jgi:hypothetical protein
MIATMVLALISIAMVVTGQQFDLQPGAAITENQAGTVIRVNAVRDKAVTIRLIQRRRPKI